MGIHDGALHGNQLVFLVWMFSMRFTKPDVILHEITEGHPSNVLGFWLGHLYHERVHYLSPSALGWPICRPRKFTVLTLKSK